jgi:putative transposase
MPSYCAEAIRQDCDRVLAPFLAHADLPFADVLTGAEVDRALADDNAHFGSRNAVYTAPLTLWGFLSQGVHKDKTCLAAALRIAVLLVVLSRTPGDTDSGGYCRARAKLPPVLLRRLAVQVGCRLERQAPDSWLWHGRHAMLVDGFTVLLPDTPDNQQRWPQHQAKTGTGVSHHAVGGDPLLDHRLCAGSRLRSVRRQGNRRDGLVSHFAQDAGRWRRPGFRSWFGSYFMLALALRCGVDVVTRLNERRTCDFRRGKRLGYNDHVVEWQRPVRPEWMTPEEYKGFPETLKVREIRAYVNEPGFRVESLVVVTTLLDDNEYDKEEIADLYRQRWQVELDIRSLKVSLQMEYLRCMTPFMVEKEIWSNVLSYNLLRKVAAQAAQLHRLHPRQIRFEATRKAVEVSWTVLSEASPQKQLLLGRFLLKELSKKRVGNRPGRTEPRAVKRRPKQQRLLTKPRGEAKAELLKGRGNDARGSKAKNARQRC